LDTAWGGVLPFKLTGGNLVGTTLLVTLAPTVALGAAAAGVEKTVTIHLPRGKTANQTTMAADIQEALDGIFEGSNVTVAEVGATLTVTSDKASGALLEQICFLSDEDMQDRAAYVAKDGVLEQKLASGNKWISNEDGASVPLDTFVTGTVVLPKDVNTAYLSSDTLAGYRDTMGPVPGQKSTIAKISLGGTAIGAYHHESLFRPHLFTTLARTDISKIDFALRDSRGVNLDLGDTNFSFVVTFDNSHLAIQ